MDRVTFTHLIESEMQTIIALNQTKGIEYAGHDDALSNFTRRATELGISPYQVWSVLAGKHWDAIESYCKTGNVLSEPIESRIRDLILYALLLLGLIADDELTTNE